MLYLFTAACATDDISNDDAELGIDNVGGVFLVLGIGVFCAYIIVVFEFLWNIRTVAVEEKVTFWEAFWAELKFVLDIRITTKPVTNQATNSMSTQSSQNTSDVDA
jgi:glutamate receptor, ionotropic, invertebrate